MARSIAVASLLAVLSVAGADAGAEPISFYAMPPLGRGEVALLLRGLYDYAPDGPAPERAIEKTATLSLTVMVGLSSRITLSATGSLLRRVSRLSLPMGSVERRVAGLGDSGLLVTAGVFETGELALDLFAGLELPTGEADAADELGRFPQRFQLGLGGWGAVGGALGGWRRGASAAELSVSYFTRSSAHDFDPGDELRSELSLRRTVLSCRECSWSGVELEPAAEMRLSWQGADRGSLAPADSGGLTWVVIPGLRARFGRQALELALEVPVVQPVDRHSAVVAELGYRAVLEGF